MAAHELARYAYHNCEFQRALQATLATPACAATAALHVKILTELDAHSEALAAATAAAKNYSQCGLLKYLLGIARYLAGEPKAQIEAAFLDAADSGFAGGAMGLAFLEATSGNHASAMQLLEQATTLDTELEHARRLALFQTAVLMGDDQRAEAELVHADEILRCSPSLLRQRWGQLCWVRLMRSVGRFDAGLALVERLLPQLDAQLTPRLYRNAFEARRMAQTQQPGTNLIVPQNRVGATKGPDLTAVSRKPMLHSLYQYLAKRGADGATKEELVEAVWEERYNPPLHDDRIYKAIARLRHLLGDDRASPRWITQRGRNYVLTTPALEQDLPGDR